MKIGGIFYLKIDGNLQKCGEGAFSFHLGGQKREAKMSSSGVAGFITKPLVPYCEGDLIVSGDLDIEQLRATENATITIELANGKSFILKKAWYCSDSEISTEGHMKVRFEGISAELVNI